MHLALQSTDLLLRISEYLDLHNIWQFSRTCKVIWAACGHLIWRRVDPSTLHQLLPKDVRVLKADAAGIRLSRQIKDAEWRLLLHYGQHIHVIFCGEQNSEDEDNVTRHTLPIIAECPLTETVLPQLQCVSLELDDEHVMGSCTRFLKRPIRELSLGIQLHKNSPGLLRALERLLNATSNFESLPMHELQIYLNIKPIIDSPARERLEKTIAAMILRLKDLRVFKVTIDPNPRLLLPIVAAAEALEVLEINTRSEHPRPRPYFLPIHSFPSLRKLTIGGIPHPTTMEQADVMELLYSITSPSFASLDFFVHSLDDLHSSMKLIASRWSSCLLSLKLHIGVRQGNTTANGLKIPTHVLAPLLQCISLRNIQIACCLALSLSDEQYEVMTLAWPRLTGFSIVEDWTFGRFTDSTWRPLATRRSVGSFATGCPDLRHLSVPFDFDLDGSPRFGRLAATIACSLDYFDIPTRTNCTDTKSAVLFLHSLFPRLDTSKAEVMLRFLSIKLPEALEIEERGGIVDGLYDDDDEEDVNWTEGSHEEDSEVFSEDLDEWDDSEP